eukprot:COSAG01_NODE_4601_length_4886_cov_4.241278_1_plen_551_part_00
MQRLQVEVALAFFACLFLSPQRSRARPLVTGGANGLTISPSGDLKLNDEHGNVGLGTADPNVTLHVSRRAARVQGSVRLGFQSACSEGHAGAIRYHGGHKEVQVCTRRGWAAIAASPTGQTRNNIPGSCRDIFRQNPALPDGSYHIKTAAGIDEQFCTRQDFVPPVVTQQATQPRVDIVGCMIPIARNYDMYANIPNNSACVIYGCNETGADNFLSVVTHNDGSCFYSVFGCLNQNAPNFNPAANRDDGSCFDVCYRSNPCASCAEVLSYERPTGIYWIGQSSSDAKQTLCEMNLGTYGGGWTLIMKAATSDTFQYSAGYWSQPTVLNEDVPVLKRDGALNLDVDAKYEAFNVMNATEYVAFFPDEDFYWHVGPLDPQTPLAFFDSRPPTNAAGVRLQLPTCAATYAAQGTCQTTPTNGSVLVCSQHVSTTGVQTCTSQWDSISVQAGLEALVLSNAALVEPAWQNNSAYFSYQSGGNQLYVINYDAGSGQGIRWGFVWSDQNGREGAGGGIGRTGVSSRGTFSAGDWYQHYGTEAQQGNKRFRVVLYAR